MKCDIVEVVIEAIASLKTLGNRAGRLPIQLKTAVIVKINIFYPEHASRKRCNEEVNMTGLKSSFSEHQFLNILIVIVVLYCSGCLLSKDQIESPHSDLTKPSLQPIETIPLMPRLDKQSLEAKPPTPPLGKQLDGKDIIKVDFRNFTYPVTEDLRSTLPSRTFSVVDGGYSFQGGPDDTKVKIGHLGTIYGYVTGKGDSLSAIVVFSVAAGSYGTIGTGRSQCVYIYSMPRGKLELLWSFETGDRADGGLRNIYAANGNLTIETYIADVGSCASCAKTFKQSIYEWAGSRFKLIEARKLDNPSGSAYPVLGERK